MSINFTSDIDGATSGSGITQITVGGKTINLSEVSSGESGVVASGSFTPEAQETSRSIDTGIDFTHFFIYKKTPELNYGYRTFCGLFADIENDVFYFVGTNSGGTAAAGKLYTWTSQIIGTLLMWGYAKDGTTFSITLSSSTEGGVFCPEEYVWYAW